MAGPFESLIPQLDISQQAPADYVSAQPNASGFGGMQAAVSTTPSSQASQGQPDLQQQQQEQVSAFKGSGVPQVPQFQYPTTPKISFKQKLMSVFAAGDGNFGPMMQLMDQEKRTEINKSASAVIQEADKRRMKGDYEGAYEVIQGDMKRATASPELMTIYQGQLDYLRKAQEKNLTLKSVVEYHKINAKDNPQYTERDHKIIAHMDLAAKQGTPISDALLTMYMGSMDRENRYANGMMLGTGKGSRETGAVPVPISSELKEYSPFVIQEISKLTNLQPDEIVNIQKGLPVMKVMVPGQPPVDVSKIYNKPLLDSMAANARGQEQAIGLGKDAATDPAVTTQRRAAMEAQANPGNINLRIATNDQYGRPEGTPPIGMQSGVEGDTARKGINTQAVELAKLEAINKAPDYQLATGGAQHIRVLNEDGTASRKVMSGAEADKDPKTTFKVNKDDGLRIDAHNNTINKLEYANSLSGTNDDSLMSSAEAAANRALAVKYGYSVNPQETVRAAKLAIISSAIADMQQSGAPTASVDTLQKVISGSFSGPGIKEAIKEVQGVIKDQNRTILGESAKNIPKATEPAKHQAPTEGQPAITGRAIPKEDIPAGIDPNSPATPNIQRISADKRKQFDPILVASASKHKVDPILVYALTAAESGYNPLAISKAGAIGLMQVMPATAESEGLPKEMHIGSGSVERLVDVSMKYLKKQLDNHKGDIPLALAAYNAGPGKSGVRASIPQNNETPAFVTRVMANYVMLKASEAKVQSYPKTPGGARLLEFK